MTNTIFAVLVILTAWNAVLTYLYVSQQQFFKQFTKNIAKPDLKTLLKKLSFSMKKISTSLEEHENNITDIQKASLSHFQHIGFVRFNPFSDTGGDQSFSMCLLDKHQNGFVITSLHSREQTRIYAKEIKNGKSKGLDFSKEEKIALKKAVS